MRVHILTAGFTSPNACAFLMPLIIHDNMMQDHGVFVSFYYKNCPEVTNCDVLILDSKFYSPRWASENEQVLTEISRLKEGVKSLIFMDILDSASWDHARALPIVSLYCKAQLMSDRSVYLKPQYGYRTFSHYYHKMHKVNDENPVFSEAVNDPKLLKKLTVSWNSGLSDYSWLGPYKQYAYQRFPWRKLLSYSKTHTLPSEDRDIDISCRIGTRYNMPSVAYQRTEIARRLNKYMRTNKISRRHYLAEMSNAKLVVSPFGFGEITLRDFEIFMSGSLLLKPDMSNIDTWPNLFVDGETMIAHSWDLEDMEQKIEHILANYDQYLDIAIEGQNRYRRHLIGPEAAKLFTYHFISILEKASAQHG